VAPVGQRVGDVDHAAAARTQDVRHRVASLLNALEGKEEGHESHEQIEEMKDVLRAEQRVVGGGLDRRVLLGHEGRLHILTDEFRERRNGSHGEDTF
jgi:hypothetical protein